MVISPRPASPLPSIDVDIDIEEEAARGDGGW
jgi:hypothetical protein